MRLCNGYVGEENYEHSKIVHLTESVAITTNSTKGRNRRVHVWTLVTKTEAIWTDGKVTGTQKFVEATPVASFDFKLFAQRGK